MLNIIQRFVELKGWKFGRLDGNTNVASRQRLVDTFNSDESYFGMLCTTRTGGVGLNLTGADRIILYDRKFRRVYYTNKASFWFRMFTDLWLMLQLTGILKPTLKQESELGDSVKRKRSPYTA